jgi:HSP20 family protein
MFLTATRRDVAPAAQLFGGLNRLNWMLDEAFNGSGAALAWMPACDIIEDKEQLKVVLELPGVRPEDVKINLENQVLTVRGEKKVAAEESKERWHRYERSYGSFERSFTLPGSVDAERIHATAEHGVLTLTLPKSEKAKPREIPVTIS